MNRNLVFVHGRAQEKKDADALKREWIGALQEGLAAADLSLSLKDEDIRFPYYGQTLYDLVNDAPEEEVADVIVRGEGEGDGERAFVKQILQEVAARGGVTREQILAEDDTGAVARNAFNNEHLLAIVRALDHHVKFASGMSIALATRDVYQYLTNPGLRDRIEAGVRAALSSQTPSVVVSHSLGTIVAYNLLRREARAQNWQVPAFITLGSPLGVSEIKKRLSPIGYPHQVGRWFNARDPLDLVALYPLDQDTFPIKPAIENKNDVANSTNNRHGISGYLRDPEIARRVHDALI